MDNVPFIFFLSNTEASSILHDITSSLACMAIGYFVYCVRTVFLVHFSASDFSAIEVNVRYWVPKPPNYCNIIMFNRFKHSFVMYPDRTKNDRQTACNKIGFRPSNVIMSPIHSFSFYLSNVSSMPFFVCGYCYRSVNLERHYWNGWMKNHFQLTSYRTPLLIFSHLFV